MSTTQASELELARRMLALAIAAYAKSTTIRGRRDAADEIEFWSNKAAYIATWATADA